MLLLKAESIPVLSISDNQVQWDFFIKTCYGISGSISMLLAIILLGFLIRTSIVWKGSIVHIAFNITLDFENQVVLN